MGSIMQLLVGRASTKKNVLTSTHAKKRSTHVPSKKRQFGTPCNAQRNSLITTIIIHKKFPSASWNPFFSWLAPGNAQKQDHSVSVHFFLCAHNIKRQVHVPPDTLRSLACILCMVNTQELCCLSTLFSHTLTHTPTPLHTHTHTHTHDHHPQATSARAWHPSLWLVFVCILAPRFSSPVDTVRVQPARWKPRYCTCATCRWKPRFCTCAACKMETKILNVCSLQDGNQVCPWGSMMTCVTFEVRGPSCTSLLPWKAHQHTHTHSYLQQHIPTAHQ
jgi:hypothetical protein